MDLQIINCCSGTDPVLSTAGTDPGRRYIGISQQTQNIKKYTASSFQCSFYIKFAVLQHDCIQGTELRALWTLTSDKLSQQVY